MARLGRILMLAIACITFVSAVPRAQAQVVVVRRGRYYHGGRYYHHRSFYYRHHRRFYRYY